MNNLSLQRKMYSKLSEEENFRKTYIFPTTVNAIEKYAKMM